MRFNFISGISMNIFTSVRSLIMSNIQNIEITPIHKFMQNIFGKVGKVFILKKLSSIFYS